MFVIISPMFLLLLNQVCCARIKEKTYSELKNCDVGDLATEIASYENVVRDIVDYSVSGPFKGKMYDDSSEESVLPKDSYTCDYILRDKLKEEITSYQYAVKDILQYVMEGNFKGVTYEELAKFVDKFGARPSGSETLENSIDYMIQLTRDEDINDIITEELEVPHWTRGEEKVTMLEPRVKDIAVLGLGRSVSTPSEGITAEVVVINNFDHLNSTAVDDIRGKIVLYNPIFTTYSETVVYRSTGAIKAAEKGAVASLVRSIAPFSINSPHTGSQNYDDNILKIPTAAITLEDADLIARMASRGEKVTLKIQMASTIDSKISRNTIIDIKGREQPDRVVIVSGHIDSWDVGQGAMDDGGGVFVSWAVPVILKRLGLRPKRTIRTIFWTAEELGLIGAKAYAEKHSDELDKINFVMESDEGTFAPLGLAVGGNQEARCIVAEILKLFKSINATTLIEEDSPGSDIAVIVEKGIPGASLHNSNMRYFWFHHTEGDTMAVEDQQELDVGAAFWTAVAYIIADLSVEIPR